MGKGLRGVEVVEDLNWRSIYLLPRFCTISTRIRNFKFKFLHRRIATNTGMISGVLWRSRVW